MKSKRQTTRAKLEREQKVQQRREQKREKKQMSAAERVGDETEGASVDEVEADTTT